MTSSILRTTLLLTCIFCLSLSSLACTIFVLTDSKRTLFFNNEDYSNPSTRIWFLPGVNRFYGTAYLGFNNDWAQGGVNTKGLAFDWVADNKNDWKPSPKLLRTKGNPSERMLESCATVDEAIYFFQKYADPSFSYSRILIADKSGASVIIGVRNGRLYFDKQKNSRGFGYGGNALQKMLTGTTKPSFEIGLPILKTCLQEGNYATKYSNVYDLTGGEISLVSFSGQNEIIKFNLVEELSKGGHYYDLPQIKSQIKNPIMSLNPTMYRFLINAYKPIKDKVPSITKKVKQLIEGAIRGKFNKEDFNPEFWISIEPNQKQAQNELQPYGKLKSLSFLEQGKGSVTNYLFLVDFEFQTILQRYFFDYKGRISGFKNEGAE